MANLEVIDFISRDNEPPTKVWLAVMSEVELTPEGQEHYEIMVRFPTGDVSAACASSLRRAKGVGMAVAEVCGCPFDGTLTGG